MKFHCIFVLQKLKGLDSEDSKDLEDQEFVYGIKGLWGFNDLMVKFMEIPGSRFWVLGSRRNVNISQIRNIRKRYQKLLLKTCNCLVIIY